MNPFIPTSSAANKTLLTFLLLLFLFISPPLVRAQEGDEHREKVESMKIGFLTQKLDLSPEEAQNFWPVYNQYRDKLKELRKNRRAALKNAKQNTDEMSDKEVEALVDGEIVLKQKELEVKKEYHSKFKSILPIKKVAKLYEAEEQFKVYLLKQLQEKQGRRAR